jgi:hypothetical protein
LPASKPSAVLSKNDVQAIREDKISFFPNPVKDELHIKTPDNREGYYYQIYNMSGQLVKSGKFENGKDALVINDRNLFAENSTIQKKL